MTFVSDQ